MRSTVPCCTNWTEARAKCEQADPGLSTLASPRDEMTNMGLTTYVNSLSTKIAWIGLHTVKQGEGDRQVEFRWTDGTHTIGWVSELYYTLDV